MINHPSYNPAITGYTAGTWAIDTGDGTQIAAGLGPEYGRKIAQQRANERGETVAFYDASDPDDAEIIEPEVTP
jgi:hypothetical protein